MRLEKRANLFNGEQVLPVTVIHEYLEARAASRRAVIRKSFKRSPANEENVENENAYRLPRLKGATCMTLRGTDKKGGL